MESARRHICTSLELPCLHRRSFRQCGRMKPGWGWESNQQLHIQWLGTFFFFLKKKTLCPEHTRTSSHSINVTERSGRRDVIILPSAALDMRVAFVHGVCAVCVSHRGKDCGCRASSPRRVPANMHLYSLLGRYWKNIFQTNLWIMTISDSVFALGPSPNLDLSSTHLLFLTFTVWESTTAILFLHNGIFINPIGHIAFKFLRNSPRLSHKEVTVSQRSSFTLMILSSKCDFARANQLALKTKVNPNKRKCFSIFREKWEPEWGEG